MDSVRDQRGIVALSFVLIQLADFDLVLKRACNLLR